MFLNISWFSNNIVDYLDDPNHLTQAKLASADSFSQSAGADFVNHATLGTPVNPIVIEDDTVENDCIY